MASISEFRGALSSGLVRQHKWDIVIDFPTGVGTSTEARKASLLARTTSVPSSTLGVIELWHSGRMLPLAGDRTFEEFTLNFINVNDHEVRDALERWSEMINGSETNTGSSALDDYMRDITLNLLDMNDNITKTYVLQDAFPSIVGSQELDSGSQDTYAEFSVTFRYVNYRSNTTR